MSLSSLLPEMQRR